MSILKRTEPAGRRPKRSTGVGFLTRLAGDRRGVSAVEFALIAPIMITFYFGLAEFCQGYMAQRRLAHSASAVADLVAQTTATSKADLDDAIAMGALIMKPFSATTLTVQVSHVTRDANGVAKVDWSRASGVAALAKQAVVTVPAGMILNGESAIMTQTTYQYSSPVGYLLPAVTALKSTFYERPRQVNAVPCPDC